MICPSCGYDNLPGSEQCSECEQDLTHLDQLTPQDQVEEHLMEDIIKGLNPSSPISVSPTTTLSEAIDIMIQHNVGMLLITGENGRLDGIITERDILMRVANKHQNYKELPVSMFMTSNPETITENDKLVYAIHKMDGGDYRHLPVLQDDKAVGVISVRDVLRHITEVCDLK